MDSLSSTTLVGRTSPVIKKDQSDDTFKFQPLPSPSGRYPYHLALEKVCHVSDFDKLVFHLAGDTGGTKNPGFRHHLAEGMSRQYTEATNVKDKPLFLYHLGDVVYHYGEFENYYEQFFAPFQNYPGAIFAIPGNHDGDVNPDVEVPYQSLDAFTAVFCDTARRPVIPSRGSARKSMTQPNVYWTLDTPLATFIGLYSNVPKYGVITSEQRNWLIQELLDAEIDRPGKALIICVHHAPYSADTNHGSSIPVIELLEGAFEEAGVYPDIVFSGHVHNYQRFHKKYPGGIIVPYIVAGAGGFDELHPLAAENDEDYTSESPLFDDVTLQNYCDDKHGFLKVTIERQASSLTISGEYYTASEQLDDTGIVLADSFSISVK